MATATAIETTREPDPRAVQVASRLKNVRPAPRLILLFGSRARGDHRPTSDLDIILVYAEPKDPDHRLWRDANDAERVARKEAERIYRPDAQPTVDLHHYTENEARELMKYRNSVLTNALLDGRIIKGSARRWTSPYDGPDPARPVYDWGMYQHHLALTKMGMDLLRTAQTGTVQSVHYATPSLLQQIGVDADHPKGKPGLRDARIRSLAGQTVAQALQTLVAACGSYSKYGASARDAQETARGLLGPKETELSIEAAVYDRLVQMDSERPRPPFDHDELAETALADADRIRRQAMRTRRRNGSPTPRTPVAAPRSRRRGMAQPKADLEAELPPENSPVWEMTEQEMRDALRGRPIREWFEAPELRPMRDAMVLFEALADRARICRQCVQRRTLNRRSRYCYAPCHPNHSELVRMDRPARDDARVFSQPPTLRQLADLPADP